MTNYYSSIVTDIVIDIGWVYTELVVGETCFQRRA